MEGQRMCNMQAYSHEDNTGVLWKGGCATCRHTVMKITLESYGSPWMCNIQAYSHADNTVNPMEGLDVQHTGIQS